ncbi:MAG TPA: MarC family protein, partial [Deltaproteobacteria bacterium]|nr:MarC family protein [Deltaproteobacteria bacterium]
MGEGSARDIVTTAATLFFILDPLGNIPTFHAVLANVPVRARRRVILRELFIALFVLVVFLVAGVRILGYLGLTQPSLGIAGGIMLFVIALRMVFPQAGQQDDAAI